MLTAGQETSSRKLDGAVGAVLGRSSERMEWRTGARKVLRKGCVLGVVGEGARGLGPEAHLPVNAEWMSVKRSGGGEGTRKRDGIVF